MSVRAFQQLWPNLWPTHKFAEAVQAVGHAAGLTAQSLALVPGLDRVQPPDPDALPFFVGEAARALELESVPVPVTYDELRQRLVDLGPTLIPIENRDRRLVVVVKSNRRRATLLRPDRRTVEVTQSALCELIGSPVATECDDEVAAIIAAVRANGRRGRRMRDSLLEQLLYRRPVASFSCLQMPPESDFWQQMRRNGLTGRLLGFVSLQVVFYAVAIAGWWLVGRGALRGSMELGWLVAWILAVSTLVPLRVAIAWWQGTFALGTGVLLRRRVLQGILRLKAEEMRLEGAGQSLGRVIESQALESLALGPGLSSALALIELLVAMAVLTLGAGGWGHGLLLLVWTAAMLRLAWSHYRTAMRWTETRLSLTHDLVEKLVGHRTRAAQQERDTWHDDEDEAIVGFFERSQALDRSATLLVAALAKGWAPVGILGLLPAAVVGEASVAAVAIGAGGVVLGLGALNALAGSSVPLIQASVAWRHAAPLFRAARRRRSAAAPEVIVTGGGFDRAANATTLLEAQRIHFGYRPGGPAIIRDIDLRIAAGDRIVLEGPSGGGKSTLASLIAGLREPESGLLLLRGFDRHTMGAECWRREIVVAPQFHENHIFANTLAFNLLMGRRWPPTPNDLRAAWQVCVELGLGDLVQRMPAGMNQVIGESGWQLSHGERSRVYIARALLQDADLVLLDESFAALDPESLSRAFDCVAQRARSLLVVAHP